ncbi:LysR family transcriptional regulator [Aestuariivita sp.]|jgi:DNA-binding transcriptional LysR family regulator|uniref:LysR family transcriptional regulator n=1 Tax=Aestuariivita sp. TaxID=1872407 RepID=UPI00216E8755|nr:LysR family transcriptional regulator [Aestuariivita sp.]MCE8006117.1 LysR family transcriptional regulator [Aestuariivita sp.]
MAIKFEMLRVFRTVAEKGSLAGAGGALGRTPSAVSMMLAQLEEEIGAPLFETDRKNRLTPLGQHVLDESNRATDAFGRSVDAIRRHAASLAGTVRIAAIPSAAIAVLPSIVAMFRVERPEVRLEISDVDTQEALRRIMMDEADIGIISATSGTAEGVPILEDDLGIVCRTGGPISRAAQGCDAPSWELLTLEGLIANPLCHLVQHPTVTTALRTCNLEARNTIALLSFVSFGIGATILPRSAVNPQDGQLEFIVPQDPATRRELRKIAGAQGRFSPAVEAFWQAL